MHPSDTTSHWQDLLRHPVRGDHIVQVYQDEAFLTDAVRAYLVEALRLGEGALLIATPEHCAAFLKGVDAALPALRRGQLRRLDAEATLSQLLRSGRPERAAFHKAVAAPLAELRLQYPCVRAYGEMVNLLWQRGDRPLAIELEGYWSELSAQQGLSVFCAYSLDNLDSESFDALESVCRAHTHLIPDRDYARFNDAVAEASKKVLDQPLAQMLLSVSAGHRPSTSMPYGQATLFWLKKNMPRTAERVLAELRSALRAS